MRFLPFTTRADCSRFTLKRGWIGRLLILLIALPQIPCGFGGDSAGRDPSLYSQSPGTRRMIEMLEELNRKAMKPKPNGFWSAQLVEYYRELIATAATPTEALNQRPNLAIQLLLAGRSEEALREFDSYIAEAAKAGVQHDAKQDNQLSLYRALCYLRMGEQENCLSNHTSDSCLVPIQGSGIHHLPRGSRGAIEVLSTHLEKFPSDQRARWLLNLAYMTLGEYPEKVPAAWRFPAEVFASDYDIKRFPDVAGALGLDVDGLAGGSVVEDFDGDGYLDIMATSWALQGEVRYFHNNKDGTFTERSAEGGLHGLFNGLNAMQTDYNNDGHADVFITRGAWLGGSGRVPNSLLRNNGNGTFADVTEEAGLLSFHPTQTATWFDYNSDGWLDVFIGNESWADEVHPCELFRNNGDGTFTECAGESGVAAIGYIKGVTSGDYNNDGRPDIYVSSRNSPNLLFRNDGPAGGHAPASSWKFTEIARGARVDEPLRSFPAWFWDYDNDGWVDLMVAGYHVRDVGDVLADYLGKPNGAEKARLYRNTGNGRFKDVTIASGLYKVLLAMGANFGDLDNDGWLDFYLGTGDPDLATVIPNRMFRNDGGKRFQDVTTSGGFGHIQKGHGVSFADLDNDGDQDVYIVMGGAYSGDNYRNALFLNPGHGHRWITLKLEGRRSNRAAIGARIRVVVATAEGERSIYRTVGSGASFGASPLRQEVGLGDARAIRRVEIHWPVTRVTQTIEGLEMDAFYTIREDAPQAARVELKRLSFPSEAHARDSHHHHHH
jgi:hypothetical protein